MGLLKRVLLSILKRPFRAFSLAAVVFILSVMTMAGTFLKDAVNAYFKEYVRMEGFSIFVSTNDTSDIPDDIIKEILSLEHIIGSNYTPLPEMFKPANFINIPYETDGVYSSAAETDMVTLIGNHDTRYYESFRTGDMILAQGSFPDEENSGFLVDSDLAQKNKLEIGSKLSLYVENGMVTVTLPVVGIYETVSPPMENVATGGSAVLSSSYVFCDLDTVCSITGSDDAGYCRYFYADSYESLSELYDKIRLIATEDAGYEVINCLDNSLTYGSEAIVTLSGTATTMLILVYIVSLIILFLMTMLWMRDHYEEAGIYAALGVSKGSVVLYFGLEILVVTGFALLLSLGFGSFIIHNNGERIIMFAMSLTNSNFVINTVKDATVNNAFSFTSLLASNVRYYAATSAATLLSGWIMIRNNVRDLFAAV